MHNRKIKDLRAFLNETLYNYEYQKIKLSDNEFAESLKLTCYFIDEKIISTIEYYQCNKAFVTEIEKAKDKCKDLSILLNKYKTELTKLGINPNEHLSFKKELNDAFDFETTEKKEPLPNYLDIKKEFEDFIKNDNLSFSVNSIFIETTSQDKFNNYLKLHIVEPYVDYSYLFQRMLRENIIVKTKHLDFVNWLYENKHITENIKDIIIKSDGFRSLNKSYSTQRENNFNNIFNL